MEVNELIEWVANEVDRHHIDCNINKECYSECGKCAALDILSHPDLALKGDRGFIYLAEAIKKLK